MHQTVLRPVGPGLRYDDCPRACASRFTLGYNITGLQPLGGGRLHIRSLLRLGFTTAALRPYRPTTQTCKRIGNN